MAGTWKAQNKRRPGAYINVVGHGKPMSDSPIGRLLMINNVQLGWGKSGVVPLTNVSDFRAELGYKIDDPKLAPLKEALKDAETVLYVNTNEGTKAVGNEETSPWKLTAKYPGECGNNIKVSIQAMPEKAGEDPTKATVTTLYGTSIVDQQVIRWSEAKLFTGNDYVDAEINEAVTKFPTAPLTISLTGGTTNPLDVTDLMNQALETENYAVATTAGLSTDSNLHELLVEAIKRLRESEGKYVRAVIPVDTDTAQVYNYEGLSTVANGFVRGNGDKVTTTIAAARFAGMSCSAQPNVALTYEEIDDAIDAFPRLNNEKTIEALNKGQVVFTAKAGYHVVIEQDINSLVKFTVNRPKEFSKNRIIRELDEICRNTTETFENTYLGKVSNNQRGRDLFEADRVTYLRDLQDRNMIQNFTSDDITMKPGNDSDSIVVDLAVQPVDAMEKLYMTINVD